ncbi:putative transmembrane protein [Candidatus Burkholderia brachyanthoides]|nr:putative transmembrane protein [Candidatus Burkholderia brachyanthoides]
MAQATRCPHCETVFKLDPHLLAPYNGRVRCGHCQEVFDAAHHRFELPDDASDAAQHASVLDDDLAAIGSSPLPVSKAESAPKKPKVAAPRTLDIGAKLGNQRPAPPAPPPARGNDSDRTLYAGASTPKPAANEPTAPPETDRVKQFVRVNPQPTDEPPASQTRAQPPLRLVEPPRDEAPPFIDPGHRTSEPRPAPTPAPAPAWHDPDHEDEPGFGTEPAGVGHPASANEAYSLHHEPYAMPVHWTKHKGWRVVGIVLAVLLSLLLIVQAAWWLREDVMVMVPGTYSLYAEACDQIGGVIAPPRDINGLQIESSRLRQVDGPQKLELKLSLRNRLDVALAYPALELTLLDDKNNVAVRQVLWPQEYARPGTIFSVGLAPQSAQPIVVLLETDDAVAANYRVQVFYP